MRIRQNKNTWLIALGVFVAVFLFAFLTAKFKGGEDVEAADLGKFDPGYIISDHQMGNYNAMSEAEIQAFLTKKNPCNNTNYNYYLQLSSSSAATWHFANGHFVCLSEERFGDGETVGSGDTAAHIIWQTAQDYRINPQVLIVLLQKETGLITDPIPNNYDYRKATGYGCPDTAACSSKSYGFKNQVRNAAALFRMVLDGGWTNYPLGSNYIQYNPSAACGGSWVNIRSLATSALYRYTPYQPNASALAAGYGVGDSCGAYGNRNFYNYFEDWFGGIIDENVSDEKQIVDGVYYIEHKNSKNKVLNATGGRNVKGTNIELWSKEELLHQTWKIMYDDGYYRIQDAYSGLFVDLYGTSIKNGANIQLWSRNDSCSQKWEIKKTDNGYYKIMSTCGEEKAIDLNGGNLANGTNVQIWEDDGTDAQEWNLKPATVIAEGSYVLAAKKNGAKALDVNGALKNNGTNVQLWDQHRGGAQICYISYD